MGVSFQITAGFFRYGPKHEHWRNHDPAVGACSLNWNQHDYGVCELFQNYTSEFNIKYQRGVLRLCREMGYTKAREVHMMPDGQFVSREYDLTAKTFFPRRI